MVLWACDRDRMNVHSRNGNGDGLSFLEATCGCVVPGVGGGNGVVEEEGKTGSEGEAGKRRKIGSDGSEAGKGGVLKVWAPPRFPEPE
jgi:hypothetical protein